MKIQGVNIVGVDVDQETRCAHYHGENDIVAIKFNCCGKWFSCHHCHADRTDHAVQVWPQDRFDTRAILCGACGYQLTIHEYLGGESTCPHCRHRFNPSCMTHRHFYFAA